MSSCLWEVLSGTGTVIPGWGQWGVGTRSSYLTLHCHHQSDSVFLGNVTTILALSSQSLCSSACLEMTQTLFHIARHKTAAPASTGNGVDRLLLSLVKIHNLAWLKSTQALYAIKQGTKQQLPSWLPMWCDHLLPAVMVHDLARLKMTHALHTTARHKTTAPALTSNGVWLLLSVAPNIWNTSVAFCMIFQLLTSKPLWGGATVGMGSAALVAAVGRQR